MATNIQSGDEVLCTNAEGMEEYKMYRGFLGTALNITSTPDGEFITVYSEDVKKFLVMNVDRFQKAFRLTYRLWKDSGEYILLNDNKEPPTEGKYFDVTITLPESELENIDLVMQQALDSINGKEENATLN